MQGCSHCAMDPALLMMTLLSCQGQGKGAQPPAMPPTAAAPAVPPTTPDEKGAWAKVKSQENTIRQLKDQKAEALGRNRVCALTLGGPVVTLASNNLGKRVVKGNLVQDKTPPLCILCRGFGGKFRRILVCLHR